MAKSKSAKRRNTQNRNAQRRAQQRAHRSQRSTHQHLPKVGTRPDNAYTARRRREDLVDFGLGRRGGGRRAIALVLVAIALVVLVAFLVLTII